MTRHLIFLEGANRTETNGIASPLDVERGDNFRLEDHRETAKVPLRLAHESNPSFRKRKRISESSKSNTTGVP